VDDLGIELSPRCGSEMPPFRAQDFPGASPILVIPYQLLCLQWLAAKEHQSDAQMDRLSAAKRCLPALTGRHDRQRAPQLGGPNRGGRTDLPEPRISPGAKLARRHGCAGTNQGAGDLARHATGPHRHNWAGAVCIGRLCIPDVALWHIPEEPFWPGRSAHRGQS
jgi:hypothetical protein